jgi:hypothetical protein
MHGLAALEAGRSTAISLPLAGYGRTGERQVKLALWRSRTGRPSA